MDAFARLKRLHDELLPRAKSIVFDKRDPVDFHRIALYGSLVEFSGAIIVSLSNNARIGIPSLFRSMLEAAVEFRNLTADARYIEFMNASHSVQLLQLLEEARKGVNPYLTMINKLPDLSAHIATEKRKLSLLKKRGYRALRVQERFDRAGMIEEYRSMYSSLSCDAHSNIRGLFSRHAEIKDRDFDVVYYRDEPLEAYLGTIEFAARLLIDASLALHRAYQSSVVEEIETLYTEL